MRTLDPVVFGTGADLAHRRADAVRTPEPGTPEFWSAIRPDMPAVVGGEAVMTYAQWNDQADRVAEGLARRGFREGDRMGLRFRLCPEWFVMQRALQKLGVTPVAVNWRLTPPEVAHILRDSGAKGLACTDTSAGYWDERGIGLLVTVGQDAGGPGVRYEDLLDTAGAPARFGPRRADTVLYTSGTTGVPRGVPPRDLAAADLDRLLRYVTSVDRVPPHPDGAVCLITLPVHHGAGVAAATAACAVGGTAILLDPYDPQEALRLIDRHQVQVWVAVPTMLLRIKNLPADVLSRYDLSSITALATGAAPVPQSLKEWVIGRLGEGVLWEVYGSSEAGMVSYAAPEHQLSRPGSSGLPYDGVEIAIVNAAWHRLPPGVTGEIAASTPLVITRYLGCEELGEDTVRDGFYRTGDVGHLDGDGFLFITDRIKDVIVSGGVNIYPAEIEGALIEHPGVIDAAVVGIPEPDFGEQPLAFVVADGAAAPTARELLEFLDGRLAPYKHPRRFVFLDELPRNGVGKVLKRELRAPYWKGRGTSV
jgi:long-chain acyl-CoA synthetase